MFYVCNEAEQRRNTALFWKARNRVSLESESNSKVGLGPIVPHLL